MNRLLSVLAVITLPGAFLRSAPVPKQPEPPKLYFPLAVGTKWATASGEKERAFVVTSVGQQQGKFIVDIGLTHPVASVTYHADTLHVSREGIFQLDKHCDDGPQLIPLLRTPFRKGDTWEHSHKLAKSDLRWEYTVAGEEVVTVLARASASKVLGLARFRSVG